MLLKTGSGLSITDLCLQDLNLLSFALTQKASKLIFLDSVWNKWFEVSWGLKDSNLKFAEKEMKFSSSFSTLDLLSIFIPMEQCM